MILGFVILLHCLFAIQTQSKLITPDFDIEDRIVFGSGFYRGKFPWIVALMHVSERSESDVFFCGGSLISTKAVLTAAHCIKPKQGVPFVEMAATEINALFGAHDLEEAFDDKRQSHEPVVIHIHPDWNPDATRYDADIAILKFANNAIELNDFVKPIAISKKAHSQSTGFVAGWGKSENPSRNYEPVPKMLEAPLYESVDCLLESPELTSLFSRRTFCAGLQNGTGVCMGDSGNGFFVKVSQDFFLRGMVSSALSDPSGSCAVTKLAIYTDVLKFTDWINQHIETNIKNLESGGFSVKEVCKQPQLYCKVFDCSERRRSPTKSKSYKALPDEFPFAAALGYLNVERITEYQCNGVLISELYVLTLAHCVSRTNPYLVALGRTSLGDRQLGNGINIGIKRVQSHYDFNKIARSHDIALIELFEPVSFSKHIQPACLSHDEAFVDSELVNVGFGSGFIDGKEVQDDTRLLKVSQHEYQIDECATFFAKYDAKFKLDKGQMCSKGQSTLCNRSAGSFLGVLNERMPVLYGISARGTGCNNDTISFSTRVASVVDWIESEVWP